MKRTGPIFRKFYYILFSVLILTVLSCTAAKPSGKKNSRAFRDMGNALFIQGNPREALVNFLKAEKIDPGNHDIQNEIALVYQKIDQYDLALLHYKKAIQLKPDFSEAYNNMGVLYSILGQFDDALDCFNRALSNILYKTPHFACHNIGLVYLEKNETEKAIEFFKKSIAIDPEYLEAYFDLAGVYEKSGRFNDVIDTYNKIMSLAPEALEARLNLAKIYLKNGRKKEAASEIDTIMRTDPRSPIAREAVKILHDIQNNE